MSIFRKLALTHGAIGTQALCQLIDALAEAGQGNVGLLVSALDDYDPQVRAHAARALGWLGVATPMVTTALVTAMRDEDAPVRRHAAGALGVLHPLSDNVRVALERATHDDDHRVRMCAAHALAELGHMSMPMVVDA